MAINASEVKVYPTKSFFTTNLTRDIELQDAILDLLDNCVDGITRMQKRKPSSADPYSHYWAHITFDKSQFSIEDNCGGIPPGIAYEHAFVFGRDPERAVDGGTVGVYGIGMKRAIFKMGCRASVLSQHAKNESLTVTIPEDWERRDRWEFPCKATGKVLNELGTRIVVEKLHDNIADEFSNRTNFQNRLSRAIKQYYGRIIAKGFGVTVNGVAIDHEDFRLLVPKGYLAGKRLPKTSEQIMPYIFDGDFGGVQVDLVCGFYQPIQGDEVDEFDESVKRSADNAGWTLSCNDRVVVYNDKSELTGWGTSGVPRYHGQFRTFAGLVQFKSSDPSLLPMHTTKRGIDANSQIFLQVREYMRIGMGNFTSFTNRWKSDDRVVKAFAGTELATLDQIEEHATPLLRKVRNRDSARQYNPSLPQPPSENPTRQIKFSRPQRQIRTVAKFFDIDPDEVSAVGEAAFEYAYDEARK